MTSLREQLDQIAKSVDGGDRLNGAALYRQSIARARRRRGWFAVAAAVVVVAGVAVVPSMSSTGGGSPRAPASSMEPSDPRVEQSCAVGEERSPYANAPDGQLLSVLLGCAQLGDQEVQLLSMIQADGLCLQIVGIDDTVRGCGSAPSEQTPPNADAVAAQAIAQRSDDTVLEVYGAVSADVTEVILVHASGGAPRSYPADLIQVADATALETAGIGKRFGYFFAELPPQTTSVEARAFDVEGQFLGRADFKPFLETQPREAFFSGPSQ